MARYFDSNGNAERFGNQTVTEAVAWDPMMSCSIDDLLGCCRHGHEPGTSCWGCVEDELALTAEEAAS